MPPPSKSIAAVTPVRIDSLRLAMTCLVLAALAALVGLVPNMRYVALSALLLGIFVAYVRLRPQSRRPDLFEVIVPFGILNFLYFGVGTMYLVLRPEALEFPSLRPYLGPALALEILGCAFFIGGYGWFLRQTQPSPFGRYEPVRSPACLAPTIVGAIGLSIHTLQEAGIRSGAGISPALSFVQQFGILFHFGWFLCWYQAWAGKFRKAALIWVLAVAGCCAATVLFLTFGAKALAIQVLGMPAVAYYQVHRRLPWKTVLAVGLIAVFVVFPIYNTYRFTNRELGTARRMDVTLDTAGHWDANQFAEVSIFSALKRMTLVTSVAAILSDTGRWVNYRFGETLLLAPIGLFIPRILWPDKPNMSIGREFGETFRFLHPMDDETEVALSMLGEFYWNFSVPGVIVGMTLLGVGYRWYYQRYGFGTGYDPIRKSIYLALLPTALLFEGNFAMVGAGFVKALLIISVMVIIMRRIGWLGDRVTP